MKALAISLMLLGHSDVLSGQSNGELPRKLDSLTLVRTSCLGTCPAYRLDVSATGLVRFVSRNPADAGRTVTRASTPDLLRRIEHVFVAQDFVSLPDIVMGELPYCRLVASDHPTITITAFVQGVRVSRTYYTGCHGAAPGDTLPRPYIRSLQIIADSITAITTKPDWIRPARF